MGVQGLWELLAPVGRRVSVESIANKKVAVDASIWIVQFMKAMRDEKGEMMKNAHLIGFFRRICKLLHLKIKPVFVFDGATPELKRKTVLARRQQKDNAQAKIKKTAEKLLLNHLRSVKLGLLEETMKTKKQGINEPEPSCSVSASEPAPVSANIGNPPLNEETQRKSSEAAETNFDADIELGSVETSAGGASCLQTEKHLTSSSTDIDRPRQSLPSTESDALLAASLTAEWNTGIQVPGTSNQTAGEGVSSAPAEQLEKGIFEENDDGDDDLFILPDGDFSSKLDPAVLASLPTSVQLQLMVQMREQLVAENREKFQSVAKIPDQFSVMQIEAYLKTVSMRRNIDQVQKEASKKAGINGVSSARIASESNREFILTSATNAESIPEPEESEDQNSENGSEEPTFVSRMPFLNPPSIIQDALKASKNSRHHEPPMAAEKPTPPKAAESSEAQQSLQPFSKKDLRGAAMPESSVQTYVDEKGVRKVSRVRGMGVRMTRDLQWNLYLMRDREEVDKQQRNDAAQLEENYGLQISVDLDDKAGNNDDDMAHFASLVKEKEVDNSEFEEVEWENGSNGVAGKEGSEEEIDWEDESKGGSENEEGGEEIEEGSEKLLPDSVISKEEEMLSMAISLSLGEETAHQNLDDNPSSKHSEGLVRKADPLPAMDTEPLESREVSRHADHIANSEVQESLQDKDSDLQRDTHQAENIPEMGREVLPFVEDVAADMALKKTSGRETTEALPPESLSSAGNVEVIDLTEGSAAIQGTDVSKLAKQAADLGRDASRKVPSNPWLFDDDFTNIQESELEMIFESERQKLREEESVLRSEKRMYERNAETVTSEMLTECQELLELFGIPFIIAPTEAESQCAFLELQGLVDGVVTDDSDAFLFGAKTLFKNLFDDKKYVESYRVSDIQSELGLTREKLIIIALLLGSDYTEGISGIGIVNAIEVVNAYPDFESLKLLGTWLRSPDQQLLQEVEQSHATAFKTTHKKTKPGQLTPTDDLATKQTHFQEKHRAVSKNWAVPSTFPSPAVVDAYLNPKVDRACAPRGEDPDPDKKRPVLVWGRPRLEALKRFCGERIGFNRIRIEEQLLPAIKAFDETQTQLRMDSFLTFNQRFAKFRSKRIQNAVSLITGKKTLPGKEAAKPPSKRQKTAHLGKRKPAQAEPPSAAPVRRSSRKRAAVSESGPATWQSDSGSGDKGESSGSEGYQPLREEGGSPGQVESTEVDKSQADRDLQLEGDRATVSDKADVVENTTQSFRGRSFGLKSAPIMRRKKK